MRRIRKKRRKKMEIDKEMEASVDALIGDLQPAAPVVEPIVEIPPVVVEPVVVAPPVVEPPVVVVEPPVIDPLKVEPPIVEPKVEAPVLTAPVVAPIVVPPPVVDPRDAELTSMRSTIDDLRRTIETIASQAAAPKPAPVAEPAPAAMKFLEKEEELDQVLNSVDNFNSFMSKALGKGNEQVVANLPKILGPLVDQIVTQKMAVNEFYSNNQDLSGNKAYVGIVANELSVKNPTWTMEDIVKNLATEVRTRLKMSGQAPPQAAAVVQPPVVDAPAFVPGSPARPGSGGPAMTKMEADIAELIKEL
jgi:hypothetical protein